MSVRRIVNWFGGILIAILGLSILVSIRAAHAENFATWTDESLDPGWPDLAASDYTVMQYYRRYYSPEVFAFCYELHGGDVERVGKCVMLEQGKRKKIMALSFLNYL